MFIWLKMHFVFVVSRIHPKLDIINRFRTGFRESGLVLIRKYFSNIWVVVITSFEVEIWSSDVPWDFVTTKKLVLIICSD